MNHATNSGMQQNRPLAEEINALIGMFRSGRFADVEKRAQVLVAQFESSGIIWKLLGAALQSQGKDALTAFRKAAELMPDDAENHLTIAAILQELGQLDEAVESLMLAIKLNPGLAEAHYNVGNIMSEAGQLEAAVVCYRNALSIDPKSTVAYSNLGAALLELGQLDEALSCCRRALELDPYLMLLRSNLLCLLNYTDQTPQVRLEEARKYGQIAAQIVMSSGTHRYASWKCPPQQGRLRVGMVSSDLRGHPVGHFLEGLLGQIDQSRIELIAYSANLHNDELTDRIKPFFSAWKPIHQLDDYAAAQLIHEDAIHILLDLAGHTGHNRLPLFAWKPAPVQVTWLGYFATTGLAEMDYLLADHIGVPEARRGDFTESVRYLPDTRLCFTPPRASPEVSGLPARQKGHITFGCFQNLSKVGDAVLELWGRVMQVLPGARLRWQCKQLDEEAVQHRQLQRLEHYGIETSRVSLHGNSSREEYLAAHGEVDMILDTFPYTGGTTTCEALWMGVPTLTIAGGNLLARQGASLLTAAELPDWIALNKDEYVEKAIAFGNDMDRLASLRAGLRSQVAASTLFDAKRFARNFENALHELWQSKSGS
jgi:protein O-GlcNAc transferase